MVEPSLHNTVLEVREARRRFAEVTALDGASFALRPGELLGLLGPNGAGKTTIIRAIAGRVRLDSGEIRFQGKPLNGCTDRAQLGIVPQEIALYPTLTGRENLATFGRYNGVGAADLNERIAWALEWTGLADRADEPVKRFSGGMKRRLNLACSILHRPRVLLLDEPTVGVDPQSREKLYDMLDHLRRDGMSLLLTTHHLEEAESRCERIVIIDHGKTVAAGTLHELVTATIGRHRIVTFALRGSVAQLPAALKELPGRRQWAAQVEDVAGELPGLLREIEAGGAEVENVDVRPPSLQAAFIHLTGKELRE